MSRKLASLGSRTDILWLVLLLTAVTTLYFPPALFGEFLAWDDDRFIYENELYLEGGIDYVISAISRVQFEVYAPVHLLSYLPDRALWMAWPGGYRVANLVIFLGSLGCMFVLSRRHASTPAVFAALLLFALHPLRVESVAWITARKGLLALLFVSATLLVEDRRTGSKAAPLGLLFGTLAMLSKAAAVCLPLLLLAHLRWLRGHSWKEGLLRILPLSAVAAVMALVTLGAWREGDLVIASRPDPALVEVMATFATHLWRALLPFDLSPIYPRRLPAPECAAACAVLLLVTIGAFWRRLPAPARCAPAAFVLAVMPVSNIVPMAWRFADRYSLLAHAALVVPLAIGAEAAIRKAQGHWASRNAIAGAAILVVGIAAAEYAVASRLVGAWGRSSDLFNMAVARQPDAHLAHMKLGQVQRDAGDFVGAVASFQTMIRLRPQELHGYSGLFYCYARREETAKRIPSGSAKAWLTTLATAVDDPKVLTHLRGEVARAGCAPCAGTLLLLGLQRWPQSDTRLLANAELSLRHGDTVSAAIFLSRVKDRTVESYERLADAVGRRLGARGVFSGR